MTPIIKFESIKGTVAPELDAVEELLRETNSSVEMVNDISNQILSSGGKRLRPLITLLSAACFGSLSTVNIQLGAIVELIHAATLLHDDVIDNSTKRRNKPTANFIWDNKLSILAGDFVYALAFQKMTLLKNIEILEILSGATSYIVEGEIIQLTQNKKIDIIEEEYFQVIDRKTARLFKIASELGAVAAKQKQEIVSSMAKFGQNFGMAYQIINDILDYIDNIEVTGKNYGDDLTEGKPTLPFILAYKNADINDQKKLEHALRVKPEIEVVAPIIKKTNSIEKSTVIANEYIEKALDNLTEIPSSAAKISLENLCHYTATKINITS